MCNKQHFAAVVGRSRLSYCFFKLIIFNLIHEIVRNPHHHYPEPEVTSS